jgi:hypothetical protein
MNSNIHKLFGQKTNYYQIFANNWSSDLIYGCFRSLAKNFPIKMFALVCDYFSNWSRMSIVLGNESTSALARGNVMYVICTIFEQRLCIT